MNRSDADIVCRIIEAATDNSACWSYIQNRLTEAGFAVKEIVTACESLARDAGADCPIGEDM